MLSKAILGLTTLLLFLLLLGWIGNHYFFSSISFCELSAIAIGNYSISLFYIFAHTYFYKKQPFAFGFIAMVTLTAKFILAYVLFKIAAQSLSNQLILKSAYFIDFAIFLIADVVYAVLLLNRAKK